MGNVPHIESIDELKDRLEKLKAQTKEMRFRSLAEQRAYLLRAARQFGLATARSLGLRSMRNANLAYGAHLQARLRAEIASIEAKIIQAKANQAKTNG